MIEHECSIHVNCPAEQVFAYLAETENLCRWQSGLVSSELLDEGPCRTGSRFREVRRMGRRQVEAIGEITEYEPSKRISIRTVTKPEVTISYQLEPSARGTRLSHTFAMRTSGMLRLLEPLMRR